MISTSGSNHPLPTGALFFERDGSVRLHMSSDIDEKEEKSIMMASDFFQYALQREDWLSEFLDEKYTKSPTYLTKPRSKKKRFTKHDLRVIPGGLSSGSHLDNTDIN